MSSVDDLPPPDAAPARSGGIDDLPPPIQAPGFSGVVEGYKSGGLGGAWDAMKQNKAAYDHRMAVNPPIMGTPPLVVPAGALGAFGKAMVALGEGQGVGYAAGRTALSAAQGAGMSAMDGQEGESWQDKVDRAKSGAKLSGGIQLAAESVPYVGKALGYGAKKVGEALTGVAPDLIENFAKRTDQVNDLIRKTGGKVDAMADQIREELSGGIQQAKGVLNGQISSALAGADPELRVEAKPIIDRLEAAKARLNPNFKKSAIADIDEMIANIKSQAGESGALDAKGLYETKQYLGQESSGAYNKGGQMFTRASEAARAAKEAAGEARDLVREHIPEIAQADAQLSKMHAIEGRMNKNLLAPGKSDAALMAAGAGTNPRNAANLRALEEVSGVPASQRVKDLATAREFASASPLPVDRTGKAFARLAVGAGLGGATDKEHPIAGAIAGATLASPMALKGVINAANIARKVGTAVGAPQAAQFVRQNPFLAQTVAQLGASQLRSANTDNPMQGGEGPRLLQNDAGVNRSPAKGRDAWASRGLQTLGIQDPAMAQRLMSDPKAKELLIQASDYPPGHKALKTILQKLQKGWGK